MSNAIGGIKLCVDVTQLEECRQLVFAFEQQDRQKQKCGKCASMNVAYINKPGAKHWLSSLAMLLFANYPVSAAKHVYHCFDCGAEFDEVSNTELDSIAEA